MDHPPPKPEASPSTAPGLSREQVRAWAREAGFAEAGLAALPQVHSERDAARFEEWVRSVGNVPFDASRPVASDAACAAALSLLPVHRR